MGKYKYQSAEQVQELIDQYFDGIKDEELPTITGLTLALGFNSRQALFEYLDDKPKNPVKRKCIDLIKKAKTRVEHAIEQRSMGRFNPAGPIFWLKANAGWRGDDKGRAERIEISFTSSSVSKGKPKVAEES